MISDRELFGPFKVEPYRSRALLDLANGQRCVRCGKQTDGETVGCHLHGKYSHLFSKGGSQKSDDFMIFFGCFYCHQLFDSEDLAGGNWNSEDEKALEFFVLVCRTWRLLIHQKKLVLAINKRPRTLEAMP